MTASNVANQIIIVGAGLAGLMTAYHLLSIAKQHHQDITVNIIANEINAPCGAGSHVINEIDGFYIPDNAPSEQLINALRNGLCELIELIEYKKIYCRLHLSYEMKCKNKNELNELISNAIGKKIFVSGELIDNSDCQNINLAQYAYSYYLKSAGQINAPEFLSSLQKIILDMGGNILLGMDYKEHIQNDQDVYEIHTNNGVFYSKYTPIIATGAEHQQKFIGDIFDTKIVYTMCCVFKLPTLISKTPIAFCDTNLYDDVLWGSVDEQNFLTIGCGAEIDKNAKGKIQAKIQTIAQTLFPNIDIGDPISVDWGATLHAPNMLPIVGRLPDCEVMGAWAGVGIVPAFVAGKAIAEWKLLENQAPLKVFEDLHAGVFEKIKQKH